VEWTLAPVTLDRGARHRGHAVGRAEANWVMARGRSIGSMAVPCIKDGRSRSGVQDVGRSGNTEHRWTRHVRGE